MIKTRKDYNFLKSKICFCVLNTNQIMICFRSGKNVQNSPPLNVKTGVFGVANYSPAECWR